MQSVKTTTTTKITLPDTFWENKMQNTNPIVASPLDYARDHAASSQIPAAGKATLEMGELLSASTQRLMMIKRGPNLHSKITLPNTNKK